MINPFEASRSISAMYVLERAGIPMKKQGALWCASCPMHVDKTPSLKVDERGHWHCYSCKRGGDAVALYSILYRVTPLEAAQKLSGQYEQFNEGINLPQSKPIDIALKERVDEWANGWWDLCCASKHTANAILSIPEICWNDPEFATALELRELAERNLDILHQASPLEKVKMANEVGRIPFERIHHAG